MASEVLPDALPYFDRGYEEPGVREAALRLVEEETRRYRPTKNYLEYLPAPPDAAFQSPILRAEFERISKKQPAELLSFKRYELPPPLAGQKNDLSAWGESVDNSMAQLQHQAVRIHNLELLQKFGINAWKVHVESLLKMQQQQDRELQQLRQQIQEVNWQRKSEQLDAGSRLSSMESEWAMLVTKNYEIERACMELEHRIAELHQQPELSESENSRTDINGVSSPRQGGNSTANGDAQQAAESNQDGSTMDNGDALTDEEL